MFTKIAWIAFTFFVAWGACAVGINSTDREKIKNAVLTVRYNNDAGSNNVQFKDGVFKKSDEVVGLDYQFDIADDPILVTKAGIAYVIMWDSIGGTGHWATLKAVNLNSTPPSEVKSFPRISEDRIQILKLTVNESHIILDVIKHGSDDPLCCPTKKDSFEYLLQ